MADEQLAQIRNEVSGMDRNTFADACVETTGVLASGVAALVKRECATWPGFRGAFPAAIAPAGGAGLHDVADTVMLMPTSRCADCAWEPMS